MIELIHSPDARSLNALVALLAQRSGDWDRSGQWPAESLRLCGVSGVFRWFLPSAWGGWEWSDQDVTRGYLRLSAACLTTTFIITQRTGACRRVADSTNQAAKERWLPGLAAGESFATVAISHLTTSRRHLAKPVLRATVDGTGYVIDGFSPWVTGAAHADMIVTGATLADGQQILVALPTDLPGVETPPPEQLMALAASHTGALRCHEVRVPADCLLAGPLPQVMNQGGGAGTGGLQTSTLAIGLASAAINYLKQEAGQREDLQPIAEALASDDAALCSDLLQIARGSAVCTADDLRRRANRHVLHCTQAALTAAKGTGYLQEHPAGRWCREALFFLVWSCPQPVANAVLCELAGLD